MFHDLLGDGKAQTGPAGAGGAGGVQTIELFEILASSPSGISSPSLEMTTSTRSPSRAAEMRTSPPEEL